MDKIKKHIAGLSVFVINLILVGVGFLFIKKADEAKKQQAKEDGVENTENASVEEMEQISDGSLIDQASEPISQENVFDVASENVPVTDAKTLETAPEKKPVVVIPPTADIQSKKSSNTASSSSSSETTKKKSSSKTKSS